MFILHRKREEEHEQSHYGYCDVPDNVNRFWKSLLYYQFLYQEKKELIIYNTLEFTEQNTKDLYSLRHIAVYTEDEIRGAVGLKPDELNLVLNYLKNFSQVY
jgi:hypothetical protein